MNTGSARGLYTYLVDTYGFKMPENKFYEIMQDSGERESFRKYLQDTYQFKPNEQEFAQMLGIDNTPKTTKQAAEQDEQGWLGQAWDWTKRKAQNVGAAFASAGEQVFKQVAALNEHTGGAIGGVGGGGAFAGGQALPLTKKQLDANIQQQELALEKAGTSYDERIAAQERVEAGVGTERDENISAGVRMVSAIGNKQRESAAKARRDMDEDLGFFDLLYQRKIGSALELGLITAIESSPQMIMGANAAGRVALGVLTAADEYDRLARERKNMSVGARATQAVFTGALEQFWESRWNPLKIEGGDVVRGAFEQQIKDWAKRGAKQKLKDLGKGIVAWGKDMFGEGVEEMATSISTDLVNTVINWFDGGKGEGYQVAYREMRDEAEAAGEELSFGDFLQSVGKGLLDDFIGGAMAGGYMGGVGAGIRSGVEGYQKNHYVGEDGKIHKYSKEQKKQLREQANNLNEIVSEIAEANGVKRKEVIKQLDEEQERWNIAVREGEQPQSADYPYLRDLNMRMADRQMERDVSVGWRQTEGDIDLQVMDINYRDGEVIMPYRLAIENLQFADDGSIDLGKCGTVLVLDMGTRKPILAEQANQVLERVQEILRKQNKNTEDNVATESGRNTNVEELPEQTIQENKQEPQRSEALSTTKKQKIKPRPVTITLNGQTMSVQISGSAVFNTDGSIDFEKSKRVFLTDSNGKAILQNREAVREAVNEVLRKEKESENVRNEVRDGKDANGEPTALPVQSEAPVEVPTQEPVQQLTPELQAQAEREQAAAAEEQRIAEMYAQLQQRVEQKGFDEIDRFKPEEAFIYDMQTAGLEVAVKNALEKIEAAKTKKNPSTRTAEVNAYQALIDKYAPKEVSASAESAAEGSVQEPVIENNTEVGNAESRAESVAEDNPLGTVYEQFKGDEIGAVEVLTEKQEGFAKDVFTHPQIEEGIGLYWGNEKAGLQKILEKHPEVLGHLQDIINGTHIVGISDNRIVLESDTHKVVISKMLGNKKTDNWILSAYEKKQETASTSDIETESKTDKQDGTAALQTPVSDGKGTTNSGTDQIKDENNAVEQGNNTAGETPAPQSIDLMSDDIVIIYNPHPSGNQKAYQLARRSTNKKGEACYRELNTNGIRQKGWTEVGKQVCFIYDAESKTYRRMLMLSNRQLLRDEDGNKVENRKVKFEDSGATPVYVVPFDYTQGQTEPVLIRAKDVMMRKKVLNKKGEEVWNYYHAIQKKGGKLLEMQERYSRAVTIGKMLSVPIYTNEKYGINITIGSLLGMKEKNHKETRREEKIDTNLKKQTGKRKVIGIYNVTREINDSVLSQVQGQVEAAVNNDLQFKTNEARTNERDNIMKTIQGQLEEAVKCWNDFVERLGLDEILEQEFGFDALSNDILENSYGTGILDLLSYEEDLSDTDRQRMEDAIREAYDKEFKNGGSKSRFIRAVEQIIAEQNIDDKITRRLLDGYLQQKVKGEDKRERVRGIRDWLGMAMSDDKIGRAIAAVWLMRQKKMKRISNEDSPRREALQRMSLKITETTSADFYSKQTKGNGIVEELRAVINLYRALVESVGEGEDMVETRKMLDLPSIQELAEQARKAEEAEQAETANAVENTGEETTEDTPTEEDTPTIEEEATVVQEPLVVSRKQDENESEERAENDTEIENAEGAAEEIQPIGNGDFGNIYDQFRGKTEEAIAFLSEKKGGEALGALSHPEIGEIDLVWGEAGTGHNDGYGLAKLAKYHPEVLANLQNIINEMQITSRSENRIQLESERYKAAVRLTWNDESKTWLLTAFEKKNSVLDNTTDTDKTLVGEQNDTTTPLNTVISDGKGTANSGTDQINNEISAEKQEKPTADEPSAPLSIASEDTHAPEKRKATDKDIAKYNDLQSELNNAIEEEDFDKVETLNQEIAALKEKVEFSIAGEDTRVPNGQNAGAAIRARAGERMVSILQQAGVKTNVISEADLPKYIGQKKYQELRTKGGTVYGFSDGKQIFVVRERMNPDTPLHEYTHLWVEAMRKTDPKQWDKIRGLLKRSKEWQRVLADEHYEDIRGDEEKIASEVMARLCGTEWGKIVDESGKTRFDELMEQAETVEDKSALMAIRKAIEEFARKILEWVNIHIGKTKGYNDLLGRVLQMPMQDLMRWSDMVSEMQSPAEKARFEAMLTYHGTTANFDRFDFNFMGSGEGNQAYGWGAYVSSVKGVAISYAKNGTVKREYTLNGERIDNIQKLCRSLGIFNDGYLIRLLGESERTGKSLQEILVGLIRTQQEQIDIFTEMSDGEYERDYSVYEFSRGGRIAFLTRSMHDNKYLLQSIGNNNIQVISSPRHLYEVEIPDDTGSNYLSWHEEIPQMTQLLIAANLRKEFPHNPLIKTLTEQGRSWNGQQIYRFIESIYNMQESTDRSDKRTSQFLNELGYTGVRMPVGYYHSRRVSEDMNYVIFNEDDLHIVSNTEFEIGFANSEEEFYERQAQAEKQKGIVADNLRTATVEVVNVPRHDFTGTGKQAIEQARQWALEHLVGEHTAHEGTAQEYTYTIDEDAIDKYLSGVSTTHSTNLGVHLAALQNLPEIIEHSIDAEIHPSYAKKNNVRGVENGIDDTNLLIHRMYGAASIDNNLYRVKTTMKETSELSKKPYNYEVTKVELLISGSPANNALNSSTSKIAEEQTISGSTPSNALANTSTIAAAKLLQNVEKSYEKEKKLLEESKIVPKDVPTTEFQIEDDEEPITDPDPREISEKAKQRMEKKKAQVQKLNANMNTKPAERLTGMAKIIYENQDNTWGIKILMDKINLWRKQHGKEPIPESQDVRSRLNRMSSGIASRFELFNQRERKQLEDVSDRMQKKLKKHNDFLERFKEDQLVEEDAKGNKFHYTPTVEDLLERYLIARDNIERAEMKEAGYDIDTRGEREFIERMGMSMAEYVEMFQSMFSDEELNELWEAVRACTDLSIKVLLASGRILQERYDQMKERHFYVPEKDSAEWNTNKDLGEQKDEQQPKRKGSRKKLSASAVAYKAKGGDSLATNIFANIIHDVQNSIAISEENKVRQAMYYLMQDNQDYVEHYGLPRPVKEWYVKVGERPNGTPIYERTLEKPADELLEETKETQAFIKNINDIIKELQSEMRTKKRGSVEWQELKDRIADAKAYAKEYRNTLAVVNSRSIQDADVLADKRKDVPKVQVYIDGVRYEMTFDGMKEVADALNGEYDLRGGMENMNRFNQIMASIFTTYNPTFFAVNIARDIPYILLKGGSEYGAEFMMRYAKALGVNLISTRKPIIDYLAGNLDESTPDGRLFYNFIMGGGNTGYSQIQSVKSIREDFNKTKIGRNVFEYAAKLNEYSELLTRFAAYKAMLESGYSENEALNAAKNLSTNFNMRGAGNKFINFFNSLSMFSNAAIQGATGFYKTFNTPKKAGRAFFLMCFTPAFLGFLNTLLCPDDDDEEKKVADYYRDNYMVFGPIKIPITQELRPFWRIGVNCALQMQGRRNGGQAAESIISGFTEHLMPVSPALSRALLNVEHSIADKNTGEGFVQQIGDVAASLILPQFADGVKELMSNKDFMGNTIHQELDWSDTPQFQLNQHEAEMYKDIAKGFYALCGGDLEHPSKYNRKEDAPIGERIRMNISPKEVHKVMGTFASNGMLQFACSLYGIGKAALFKDETISETVRGRDIPYWGTFVRPEEKTMYRYAIYKQVSQLMREYDNELRSFNDDIEKAKNKDERKQLERQRDAWIQTQKDRGFDKESVKRMIDDYKKSNAYNVATKLGVDEGELRQKHPEWENMQKRSVEAMNEILMDYYGMEHHITWLEQWRGHTAPQRTKESYRKKKRTWQDMYK